ncbi:MAG: hypothetical protein K2H90_04310 [Oscillospiraceae bacterium]|nr:hypothetical protein [Oscillospiraceae bacterium]
MSGIIFWTVLTAVVFGFLVTCIIEAVSIIIKKRKYGRRISIKMHNSSAMWWCIAFGIIKGLQAITDFCGLKYLKYYDFTESVLGKIKIVCNILIFFSFIFAYFLRTRAYITEKGIITAALFLPVSGVKYSVKTEYGEKIINIYTQKQMPSYTFCTKKKTAESML